MIHDRKSAYPARVFQTRQEERAQVLAEVIAFIDEQPEYWQRYYPEIRGELVRRRDATLQAARDLAGI